MHLEALRRDSPEGGQAVTAFIRTPRTAVTVETVESRVARAFLRETYRYCRRQQGFSPSVARTFTVGSYFLYVWSTQ